MMLKQQAHSLIFRLGGPGRAFTISVPWVSLLCRLLMRKLAVLGVKNTGNSGPEKLEELVEDLPKAGSGEVAEVMHERGFFALSL